MDRTSDTIQAALTVVAALGLAMSRPASAQYMIQELDGLSNAAGVNNSGQVVGFSGNSAVVWTDGTITVLGTLGGASSKATSINQLGQIVGWSQTAELQPGTSTPLERAFLWLPAPAYGLPAGMNNLGTLGGGYHSYANDLNDMGQVVGESRPPGSPYMHAFLWQNGVMTDIGTFSSLDTISEANGINNLGQVVGWSFDEEIVTNAFLWESGQMTDLGDLGGLSFNGPSSVALRLNDGGQIVGYSVAEPMPSDAQQHAFLWQAGQMTDLQLGGYLRLGKPAAINNAGDTVGYTDLHGAVLWKGGQMIVLKDALDVAGWLLNTATDINDYGQIVGYGKNPAGLVRPFILTPDCNGNGIGDQLEGVDLNSNGVPDECDPDCNGNGTPDDFDVHVGSSADVNGTGVPDECNEFGDCNANAVADYLDLAAGASEDLNANYLPDECELHGTIYVDAAAAGDPAQDGSAEHPFATIQQAIELSLSGDEVAVAPGLYVGAGNRELKYGGRSITVRSTDPTDAAVVADTIVDGQQMGRLFAFENGESAGAVLDGLTIRNGKPNAPPPFGSRGGGIFCHNSSPTIRNCVIAANRAARGGGINLEYSNATISNCTITANDNNVPCYECGGAGVAVDFYSSATIVNSTINGNIPGTTFGLGSGILCGNYGYATIGGCTFDGNHAYDGGAIVIEGGGASLTNCTIINNTASDGGGIYGNVAISDSLIANNTATHDGGGLWAGSATVTNCTFLDNATTGSGGGFFGSGTFTDCTFVSNSAGYAGGAIKSNGALYLTDCLLSGNSAGYDGGGLLVRGFFGLLNCTIRGNSVTGANGSGGGISCLEANGAQTLTNCVVSGNSAALGGGLNVLLGSGALALTNCTLSGNTATALAPQGGAAIRSSFTSGVMDLRNCILWDNTAAEGTQVYLLDSDLQVTYSDVEGGPAGITMAAAPPYPASSVVWGAGNIDADPYFVDAAGPDGQPGTGDDDLSIAPGSPCIDAANNLVLPAGVTTDLAGHPRFVDDPATSDSGNGTAPVSDIGAYEFVPPVTIIVANPPSDNPFVVGLQPFRDVLQTGTTAALTQGIGAAGTSDQDTVTYASISVTFSATPDPAPASANVVVTCNGSGAALCPTVTSIAGSGSGPYTITLSGPIPPTNCTMLTFSGTAAGQKVQYQSLPGDVSMSGSVSAADVSALVIALNNGQAALPANLARYNINRNGTVSPTDLARLVQLLNGVNTTQVWTTATVAACPN